MLFNIENNDLSIQINSTGAELWSLIDKTDGVQHLWQGDKTSWSDRAPTLFPFCGRLKNGIYVHDDISYECSIHGFARYFEHKTAQMANNSITFVMEDSAETLKLYPFKFRLYTTFSLEGKKITHAFRVENVNTYEMPFSIGYHTGYMLPFENDLKAEDYHLIFDCDETPTEILCHAPGFLNGKKQSFFKEDNSIDLDKRLVDSYILTNLKSKHVSLVEKKTGNAVKVGIEGFPYVVFWSMQDKIDFVCIEPWHGLPDSCDTDGRFDEKPGIIKLAGGESFECRQTIEIIKH